MGICKILACTGATSVVAFTNVSFASTGFISNVDALITESIAWVPSLRHIFFFTL
jgi:hypothetical protein